MFHTNYHFQIQLQVKFDNNDLKFGSRLYSNGIYLVYGVPFLGIVFYKFGTYKLKCGSPT